METKTITKQEEIEIEGPNGGKGVGTRDVEYVQITIPEQVVEHKKDDYIAQKEASLAFYQSEVDRNQEMVDGLQAELDMIK